MDMWTAASDRDYDAGTDQADHFEPDQEDDMEFTINTPFGPAIITAEEVLSFDSRSIEDLGTLCLFRAEERAARMARTA